MSPHAVVYAARKKLDWTRMVAMFTGIGLFLVVYYSPAWQDAIDPTGKHFALSPQGKGALAVFLWAGVWWVFEVVPIGVTSLLIGVLQAVLLIRPAKRAFGDFMDPAVLFILASVMIGLVFYKTGLVRRLAYKTLAVVGEKTIMLYLGVFLLVAVLTHVMAHTRVAATMYPLLLAIYSLYGEEDRPTKFGKGLFIGMAYVCSAASVITLLGSARAIVALGFFKEMAEQEVSFLGLTYYMAPLGWLVVLGLWLFFVIFFKPEKAIIPGFRAKINELSEDLGPITKNEIVALAIVAVAIAIMSIQVMIPALRSVDKSAILLASTILFFVLNILDINDLELIPWNVILLFAGAMSMGYCLWETGAAQWLAVRCLAVFQEANWFIFVMTSAIFVLVTTNFIMNVVAIAISLPVVLVLAQYLGVAPEVVLFATLAVAGMPFVLLVGAAPNAIAYESRQFTSREFFRYGVIASVLLIVVVGLAVAVIWPLQGMHIVTRG